MATIYQFPVCNPHARAPIGSAGSRAAKRTRSSAVKPAARATRVLRIRAHQSDGILSRAFHFSTRSAPASISAAMADGEIHSPIMSRNDVMRFAMPESIGQFVLARKRAPGEDYPSCDSAARLDHNSTVPKPVNATNFKAEFVHRVRLARETRGFSQREAAELLGIEQDKYKHYETRSFMPHELVPRFCLLCGVDVDWLFSGRGRAPALAEPDRTRRSPRARSRRPKAA